MLFRLYFLAVFLFLFVLNLDNFQSNRKFYENERIITNTVEKISNNTHLDEYLEALRRIIVFCNDHSSYIDINLYFGLFLANVNLKRIYIDKYEAFPIKLRVYLAEMLKKLDRFSDFFNYMIRGNSDPHNNKYKTIFSLFENASVWVGRLPKLDLTFIDKELSYSDHKILYTKRPLYIFDDIYAWLPNPKQSDVCLFALAAVKKIHKGPLEWRCNVLKLCRDILVNGTDFGYALAHRLLFLQQARYGRGCSIFSAQKDKQLSRRFCSIAYQEVEYIASRDFEIVDLLLEHVCLCALDGYAQFLRRSWLTNILRFQTFHGCFTQDIRKTANSSTFSLKPSVWKLAKNRDHDIMGGYCNGHTTALAAGTLAMACRFILQSF